MKGQTGDSCTTPLILHTLFYWKSDSLFHSSPSFAKSVEMHHSHQAKVVIRHYAWAYCVYSELHVMFIGVQFLIHFLQKLLNSA